MKEFTFAKMKGKKLTCISALDKKGNKREFTENKSYFSIKTYVVTRQ